MEDFEINKTREEDRARCGKAKYSSKKLALTIVNRRRNVHNGELLRAYPCWKCNGWHVTKDVKKHGRKIDWRQRRTRV